MTHQELDSNGSKMQESLPYRVLGVRAPGVRRGQLWQSLREDSTCAPTVTTEEATDLDAQGHAVAAPRQVSQRAPIATVDATRSARTEWTARRPANGGEDESKTCICDERLVKAETTQMR